MEELEMQCPVCGSTDVFESKNRKKGLWSGVCRMCLHKAPLIYFYYTPMEKLYNREGTAIFDKLLSNE